MGACLRKKPKPEVEDPESSTVLIEDKLLTELNRLLIEDYYEEVITARNVDPIETYVGARLIQHNPVVEDGRAALTEAFNAWFDSPEPTTYVVLRMLADEDLVYVHARVTEGQLVWSCVDIYRILDGKIVEHWDVRQELVAEECVSEHPFF